MFCACTTSLTIRKGCELAVTKRRRKGTHVVSSMLPLNVAAAQLFFCDTRINLLTDEQVFYDKFILPSVRVYAQQLFMTSLSLTSLICSSVHVQNFTNVQYTAGQSTISLY